MDAAQKEHLQKLRRRNEERLRVLEEKEATFGLNTPPEVLIEIKDIRTTISLINVQLKEPHPLSSTFPSSNLIGNTRRWLWVIPVIIIVVFLGLIVYLQPFQKTKTLPITSIPAKIEVIKAGEYPQRRLGIKYNENIDVDYELTYSFPLSDTNDFFGFQFVFNKTQNFTEYTDIKIRILFKNNDTTCTVTLFGVTPGDRSYIDLKARDDPTLDVTESQGDERTYRIPIASMHATPGFEQSEVNGLSIAAEAGKTAREHEHELTVRGIEFITVYNH